MPDKKNRNLCTAKVRKQDEFYTDRRDIEKELAHYNRELPREDRLLLRRCPKKERLLGLLS